MPLETKIELKVANMNRCLIAIIAAVAVAGCGPSESSPTEASMKQFSDIIDNDLESVATITVIVPPPKPHEFQIDGDKAKDVIKQLRSCNVQLQQPPATGIPVSAQYVFVNADDTEVLTLNSYEGGIYRTDSRYFTIHGMNPLLSLGP